MSTSIPEPVQVELKRDTAQLAVEWADGHQSTYPLYYLRGFCPCAVCQGHASGPRKFVPVENYNISNIGEAGSYALTITYEDGHDTGIYAFAYLRELCPCDECVAIQGSRHAMKRLPAGSQPSS